MGDPGSCSVAKPCTEDVPIDASTGSSLLESRSGSALPTPPCSKTWFEPARNLQQVYIYLDGGDGSFGERARLLSLNPRVTIECPLWTDVETLSWENGSC
jgi:hypothetical protein